MTVSVILLDELERRLEDVKAAIEDVHNDGTNSFGYHYGTHACGSFN